MKWVTRKKPVVARIACPWLIKKFIDPDAEIIYVPNEQVVDVAKREGANSFNATGAKYNRRDGMCSFEVFIEEFKLTDEALLELKKILHGADTKDLLTTPISAGLRAIAEGFRDLFEDDQENLRIHSYVYDALYEWCKARVAAKKKS